MMQPFVQTHRDSVLQLLQKDHKAFLLLTQIAMRARRTSGYYGLQELKVNQALIGDHENAGLTKQEYRSALRRLVKSKFITAEGSSRGTIATLIDTSVFDINADSTTDQPPNFSMKNEQRQPSINQYSTSSPPVTRKKKEEIRKATTSNHLYPCLQDIGFLNDQEKHSLMKYSEDRLLCALEDLKDVKKLRKSPISYLHWHCGSKIPPENNRSLHEKLAFEYNALLNKYGHTELTNLNKDSINNGNLYIIENGISTKISLNQSIEDIKKILQKSRDELERTK